MQQCTSLTVSQGRTTCWTSSTRHGHALHRPLAQQRHAATSAPSHSAQPHLLLPNAGVSCDAARPRRVACAASRRRRSGRTSADDDDEDDGFTVVINGQRMSVSQSNLWMLVVPAAMLLGLAALIGPLVIGITITAVALGAAASMGALALSFLWVPLSFFALSFFIFPFGAVATLGLGLLLPKVLSFAIAVGGLGLGWWAVNRVLAANSVAGATSGGSTSSSGKSGLNSTDGPVVQAESRSLGSEDEDDVRRMARELRDFDTLLAEREEQRRVDEWRRNRL